MSSMPIKRQRRRQRARRADRSQGALVRCSARCEPLEPRQLLAGTTVLIDEGFEGAFPTTGLWTVNPVPTHTVLGWEDVPAARAVGAPLDGGNWIGYASAYHNYNHDPIFEAGTRSQTYLNNMTTRMISKAFDLRPYTEAHLSFNYWLNTEAGWDYLRVFVNGTQEWATSGWTNGWTFKYLDLDQYAGQSAVTVEFQFTSDGSNVGAAGHTADAYKGAFVDRIYFTADKPDLYSGGLVYTTPNPVMPGETWNTTWKIRNADYGKSPGFWVDFYLSTDTTINTHDYYVGSGWLDYVAPSDEEFPPPSDVTISQALPSNIPAGWYHIGVIIDSTSRIPESNETNNWDASVGYIEVVGPDLAATASSGIFTPKPVVVGGPWSGRFDIWNNGNRNAGAFTVRYYASTDSTITSSDYLLGSVGVAGLAAGAATQPVLNLASFPSLPTGNYYFGVIVDPFNSVKEINEGNNVAYSTAARMLVGPDLTATANTGFFAPTAVLPGQPWAGHMDVRNLGNANAGTFLVRYWASTDTTIDETDYYLGGLWTPGLAAGATTEPVLNLASFPSIPVGDYYFGVMVDAYDDVVETNESNNIIRSTAGMLTVGVNRTLSISDARLVEGDSGTAAMAFTVNLSSPSPANVTVKYATAPGTALAAKDYNTVAGTTLTFLPGQTSKPAVVAIRGDTALEYTESFYVNLSTPVGATIADGQGIGTILDNDNATFTVGDVFYTISEGIAKAKVAIKRTGYGSGTNALPASIQYTTVNGTALAGSDYTATAGTLNFTDAQSVQYIYVPILNDAIAEADESFTFQLFNPSCAIPGRAVVGTPGSAPVTIRNDDTAGVGRILDNRDCGGVTVGGAWTAATAKAGYYASNYLDDGNAGKGSKYVTFTPATPAGAYNVYIWYPGSTSNSTATPVDIVHAFNPLLGTDTTTRMVNQQLGGGWLNLGLYTFDGSGDAVKVRNAGTTAAVVADAARFVPAGTNARPVVTLFTANPNPALVGGATVLSAIASDPDGSIAGIAFYAESNGVAGWQSGSKGDKQLLADTASPYQVAVPLAGVLPGSYMYYAIAVDNKGYASVAAKVSLLVTTILPAMPEAPAAPAELALSTTPVFSDEKIASDDVLDVEEEESIIA